MARNKRLPQGETFTTGDMFDALIDYYDLKDEYDRSKENLAESKNMRDKYRENFLKLIRASLHKNNIKPLDKTGEKNGKYYDQSVVAKLMSDPAIIKHCRRKAIKSQAYQTNSMLLQEQQKELDSIKEQYHDTLDKVGIQNIRLPKGTISGAEIDAILESEANMLEVDKLINHGEGIYLRVDELEFLGLNGLHKRADLSEDDKSLLLRYENAQLMDKAETEEIEERFYRTKLELMISALFKHAGFVLDEEQLHKDITNSVRGGDFTTVIHDKTGERDIDAPVPTVRKSYLRLQKMDYVKMKKSSDKKKPKANKKDL